MNELCAKTELFVLSSTLEPASVSQLEAMFFCGCYMWRYQWSACYVKDGHNGFGFKDNGTRSLTEVVEKAVSDRESLLQMGRSVKPCSD